MLVKYCGTEHNIEKGCGTIRLGTLRSYSKDDSNFLRFDQQEGHLDVLKKPGVEFSGATASEFTGIVVRENTEIAIEAGARVTRQLRFPKNCFIYCLSQATPDIRLARSLDPDYDDWFVVPDKVRFISRIQSSLDEQLQFDDLELRPNVPFEYLKGIRMYAFSGSVSYDGRTATLDGENFDEVMETIRNPIEWIFRKPHHHENLREYRIVFAFTDRAGQIIGVKNDAKVVELLLESEG